MCRESELLCSVVSLTENFLAILDSALTSWAGNKRNEVSLAASAMWALLHNCAKVTTSCVSARTCGDLLLLLFTAGSQFVKESRVY